MMNKVFISLGSNKGNRFNNLMKAVKAIKSLKDIRLTKLSKIYETEPMYKSDQNNFLNMVIEIETIIVPILLLEKFKNIEISLGRNIDAPRYSERKIDIDILDYNRQDFHSEKLSLPHPKIFERLFVLKPWSDISPNYILPNTDKTIKELLMVLDSTNNYIKFIK